MKKIYDVIIIGGGPAGLAAARESSRRGLSSVLLDRNKKVGKKLYATGNGRCNVTNAHMDPSCYYDSSFAKALLEKNVTEGSPLNEWVLRYLEELGIPCVQKNGYYYPRSLQASSVVWALTEGARGAGAELLSGEEVISVETDASAGSSASLYCVTTAAGHTFLSAGLILATGGASQPHLGALDVLSGPCLKKNFKLEYRPFRPVLGPVPISDVPEELNGVRVRGKLTLSKRDMDKAAGSSIKASCIEEYGELQLLTGTLSGIAAFQLSPFVSPGSVIHTDLLAEYTEKTFLQAFGTQQKLHPSKRLYAFLNGYLPDRLALYMIRKTMGEEGRRLLLSETPKEAAQRLYQNSSDWSFTVTGEISPDSSQASAGGLLTDFVDPATMQVKEDGNLFAAGEVLDVLGKCGGYNISFALRTGYLAGKHIWEVRF